MNWENNIFLNLDDMSNQIDFRTSHFSYNPTPYYVHHRDYDSILSTEQHTPERLTYPMEPLQIQSDSPCFNQNKTWMLFSNEHLTTMGQVQLNGDFKLPQLPRKNSIGQQKEEDSQTKIPNHCQICNKTFPTHRGLGGHVSRVHKNSSIKYIQKMETYKRRTQARENKSKLQAMIQNYKTNIVIE